MNKILNNRDITLDAVKGFLILCIVLEHNSLLTNQYDWIRPFCDAFAAGCFLILTFAWPIKVNSFSALFNRHFTYWWPFALFVLATSALNLVLFNKPLNSFLVEILSAIFLASPSDIKQSTGFMYLWFLPCLCVLYLVRYFLMKLGNAAIIIALIPWLFIGSVPDNILMEIPFSLHVIAFITVIGLVYSKLHKPLINLTGWKRLLLMGSFILGTIISINIGWKLFLAGGVIPSWRDPELIMFYTVFMLLAIPAIYHLLNLLPQSVIKTLAYLGEKSMIVYLFHPLIYIGFTEIIPLIGNPLLSLVFTIVLCAAIAFIFSKISWLDKIVFPKTFDTLRLRKDLN